MSDETIEEETRSNEEELWDRYLEQQQRLSCPACGESEEVF